VARRCRDGDHLVDLAAGVVERERGPDCRLQAESAQDGLGVGVPCPYCYSVPAQCFADLVGGIAVQDEGQHAGLLLGGADEVQPGNLDHRCSGVAEQVVFVAREAL
jgi:hypothetical protein